MTIRVTWFALISKMIDRALFCARIAVLTEITEYISEVFYS